MKKLQQNAAVWRRGRQQNHRFSRNLVWKCKRVDLGDVYIAFKMNLDAYKPSQTSCNINGGTARFSVPLATNATFKYLKKDGNGCFQGKSKLPVSTTSFSAKFKLRECCGGLDHAHVAQVNDGICSICDNST